MKITKEIIAHSINGDNGCYVSTGNKSVVVTGISLFDGTTNNILVRNIDTSIDAKAFVINMFCGYFKPQNAVYV